MQDTIDTIMFPLLELIREGLISMSELVHEMDKYRLTLVNVQISTTTQLTGPDGEVLTLPTKPYIEGVVVFLEDIYAIDVPRPTRTYALQVVEVL